MFWLGPDLARSIIADIRKARAHPAEVAMALDDTMRRLTRATRLLDRVVGKGLVLLTRGNGLLSLGYANLRDYAEERLGRSGRRAQDLAWMERQLPEYPATAAMYSDGSLSYSKTRALVHAYPTPTAWRLAQETHDPAAGIHPLGSTTEAAWAVFASRVTVRELEETLVEWRRQREAGDAAADQDQHEKAADDDSFPLHSQVGDDEEPKGRWIAFMATPQLAAKLEVAVELNSREAGADLGTANCLDLAIAEFMNSEGFKALQMARGRADRTPGGGGRPTCAPGSTSQTDPQTGSDGSSRHRTGAPTSDDSLARAA